MPFQHKTSAYYNELSEEARAKRSDHLVEQLKKQFQQTEQNPTGGKKSDFIVEYNIAKENSERRTDCGTHV